jgi:hypothetical protein
MVNFKGSNKKLIFYATKETSTEPGKLRVQVEPSDDVIRINEAETLEIKCSVSGSFPALHAAIYKDQVRYQHKHLLRF